MKKELVRVEPVALMPAPAGCAVFLGDGQKVVLFYIEPSIGASINAVMSGQQAPRPLTHDLFSQALSAFGGRVTRVVIVRVEGEVFYARLFIEGENEIQQHKIVELDARPSDCIALAVRAQAPIYVLKEVWRNLKDMSKVLNEMNEEEDRED